MLVSVANFVGKKGKREGKKRRNKLEREKREKKSGQKSKRILSWLRLGFLLEEFHL